MEKNILQIRLFGELTLSYGENICTSHGSRSKKPWTLIAYLIANRTRSVTQGELIELLWEEDESANPSNTLKTLLHRARALLEGLGLPEGIGLIRYTGGTCAWNCDFPCEVDTEAFDRLFRKASDSALPDEERVGLCTEALQLYQDNFLPEFESESWAVPLSAYYRSRFMQLSGDAIDALARLGRHDELCALCRRAIQIDPYEEGLHSALIRGLLAEGHSREALEHYNYVTELYFSAFGISPSDEFKALYQGIAKKVNAPEHSLSSILSGLEEEERPFGCFYCEFEVFKSVYRLEARNAARNGNTLFVCLLSLSAFSGSPLPQKALNRAMGQLSDTIRKSLRTGDVYTRYSVNQFLVMLPNITAENCSRVLERISGAFRRENPKSPAFLRTSLQPMSLPEF
ncbi:MAG: winged helix-turn-helix domain-containing protein [Clostridia bacterium]|nr:winged helix-turn-helix domain-containing protein [Clostridia bacterium]